MIQATNWRLEPVQAENKTLLYIYDDVSEYGEFNWETWKYEESETSAKYFAEQLNTIPDGQEIELHINSSGGSVKEGVAIYNLLKQKKNHKTGIVDGVAHSVAFLILQACETRKMCLGTTALVHNMWMYCAGNATQLRKFADDLDDMMEANRQVFLERASISEDELKAIMEAETYLTPDKALEYGLIDEVYGKAAPAPEKTENLLQRLSQMQQEMNGRQAFRDQIMKLKQNAAGGNGLGKEPGNLGEPKENTLMNMFRGMTRKGSKG